MNNLTKKQNTLITFLLSCTDRRATAGATGLGLEWPSRSVSSVVGAINTKHPGLIRLDVVSHRNRSRVYELDIDLYNEMVEDSFELNLNHDFTTGRGVDIDLDHEFLITGVAYGNYVTEEVAASIQKDIDDHFTGEYAEYNTLQIAMCTNSAYDSTVIRLGEINNGGEWLFNSQDFYVLSFADSDLVLLLTKEYSFIK